MNYALQPTQAVPRTDQSVWLHVLPSDGVLESLVRHFSARPVIDLGDDLNHLHGLRWDDPMRDVVVNRIYRKMRRCGLLHDHGGSSFFNVWQCGVMLDGSVMCDSRILSKWRHVLAEELT